ncbi:MAG TPA: S8 family serine peptidase [Gemmatimonadales bacterium]|nr:S8 family serine peptidase [Gemmatimonadales bacterium]
MSAPARGPADVYPEERPFWNLAQTVPGSAGFFIDTVSGNVVVSLTDLRSAEAARGLLRSSLAQELARARARHPQADVVSRPVAYTFLQLKEWRDRLNGDVFAIPGVVWLDLDEVRNRVVIGVEPSADRGAIRRVAGELTVPEAALDFETDGPVVPEAGLTDQVRPIAGGTRIQSVQSGVTVTCTLGFPALWNGTKAFVTASHCSRTTLSVDSTRQYQPTAPLTHADSLTMTPIAFEVADYSEPCPPKLGSACAWADAAIYQFTGTTSQWAAGRIARPTYGCFPGPCSPVNLQIGGYFSIAGTDSSLVVGDLVSMIGSGTGWSQSYVQKTCTNVKLNTTQVAECQDYGSYGNGTGDSGGPILLNISPSDSNVVLGGIHWGKTGQYAVFSPWSGIAREYANLSVVLAPEDTARPSVPTGPLTLPSDSSTTVRRPGGRADNVYYRNIIELAFHDSASGPTVRGVLTRYNAEIIGGRSFPGISNGAYVIRVPDPGTTFDALQVLLSRLAAEPGVHFVAAMMFSVHWDLRYRFPNEGTGMRRVNWQNPDAVSDGTRSRLAIRAPLAWGCETGTYTSDRVRVGVVDVVFDSEHEDLPPARVFPVFDRTDVDVQLLVDSVLRSHGTGVAGVMAAVGDNGKGVTGVLWGADLHLYPYGQGRRSVRDPFERLDRALVDAASRSVRVVVTSTTFGDVADTARVRHVRQSLRQYVTSGLGNVFVLAAAENPTRADGRRLTLQQLQTTTDSGLTPLDRAAAQLLDTFPNQIILVGGTDASNRFWTPSDFYTDGTRIVAPATNVLTLADPADFPGGTAVGEGNSFAAPFVTGVAGQLLAMDPSLTGPELTSFILRGARRPRADPQTGQIAPPPPVAGAPQAIYLLDAYGALTLLAAERLGAPLCGNRVWAANSVLVAERDPVAHTTKTLVSLGEAGPGVDVFHGGRRVEVSTALGNRNRAFELRQGQWVETTDTATTPPGGTYFSILARSHDWDSAGSFRYWTMPPGDPNATSASFEITVYEFASQTQTTIDTVVVPLAQRGPPLECVELNHQGECVGMVATSGVTERAVAALAFPSVGGRLLLAVSYGGTRITGLGNWEPCTSGDTSLASCRGIWWEEDFNRTELRAVDLHSRRPTFLWPIPAGVYWFGLSEDGSQLVSGEGIQTTAYSGGTYTDPGTVRGCGVRYRSMADGTEVAPAVMTADACAVGAIGHGTVAPAPPRASSP